MALFVMFSMLLAFLVLDPDCTVAQTNPSCPRNWTYLPKTNKCYQIFGAGTDGVPQKTWAQAENYCNFFGGHLAPVDSDDEITFIVRLTHATGYDDGTESDVFVGLVHNGASGWERPDGNSLAYLKWAYTGADYNNILMGQNPSGKIITRGIFMSYMWVDPATVAHPFVCQVAPVTDGR